MKLTDSLPRFLAVATCLYSAISLDVASAQQAFAKEDMGCVTGSGASCPRKYRISGGPGYVGERATWQTASHRETNMYCSPSCVAGSGTNAECSLILAFHGITSNPSDQTWLMMGGLGGESFDESQANGGPFCISFHKSVGVGWDYSCYGDDAAHIEGFIRWALDEFPSIDPEAVNLHGFSSGAIQTINLMDTSCPIEGLVTAAAPYGGGAFSGSPPTTKAAFLIAHGTHDNVVQYGEGWDEGTGFAVPTCGKTGPGFFNNFQEFYNSYIGLFGESLVAAVARFRGYTGDVFGSPPASSGSLDLIDEAARGPSNTCEAIMGNCVNQYNQPSPFNSQFSCATLAEAETNVIDYPVSAGSNPVRLLKINIHNHDYPNRRRGGWNDPTEFFFYLRRFFNENRGSRKPKPSRTIQEVGSGQVCGNPNSYDSKQDPNTVYRRMVWDSSEEGGVTPEYCSERCRADDECVESFYIDYQPYYFDKACHLHYTFLPCASTTGAITGRHFVATEATPPPPSPKTPSPTTPSPMTPSPTTPKPTDPPSPSGGICSAGSPWYPGNSAGYTCEGGQGGDSNIGTTEAACVAGGGSWAPYNCADASYYLQSVGGSAWEYAEYFVPAWSEQCCAPSNEICPAADTFLPQYSAGYSCLEGLGDSNIGTTAADCSALGGDWQPYDCETAQSYFESVGGTAWEHAEYFVGPWSTQCCSSDGALFRTADIGYTGIAGSTSFNADSKTTTLYASGADIWGTSDNFRFAYQTLQGDGAIKAYIHNPSRTHTWVKSGLMMRDNLNANSANVGLFYTGDNGVLGQYRPLFGAESVGVHVDWADRTSPIWLKISRHSGRYFEFHRSDDGVNWTKVGRWMDVQMGDTIYVGVAATANTNSALTSAKSQHFDVQSW